MQVEEINAFEENDDIKFNLEIFIESKEKFRLEYCSENDEYIKPSIYESIISEDEAKYILENAEKLYETSEVVEGPIEGVRKSNTAWLSKNDEKIKQI